MLKAEAERRIVAEWSHWIVENPSPRPTPTTWDAFGFYGYLMNDRPDLLRFRCAGDKWQVVKGWLLRRGLVTDQL